MVLRGRNKGVNMPMMTFNKGSQKLVASERRYVCACKHIAEGSGTFRERGKARKRAEISTKREKWSGANFALTRYYGEEIKVLICTK